MLSGRRAGSVDDKCKAESPKQNSKRFNSITKTTHFSHLCIFYLSMGGGKYRTVQFRETKKGSRRYNSIRNDD